MKSISSVESLPVPGQAVENGWQSIADDPEKLRYWREIARLWRASLSVDTEIMEKDTHH